MVAKQKVVILLIEDDENDALIFSRYAKQSNNYAFAITHCKDLDELSSLKNKNYDLIFMDQRLGKGVFGGEVFDQIKKLGLQAPVIVLTGVEGEEIAVAMMKKGAYDYLLKSSFNTGVLEHETHSALEYRAQRAAMQKAESELERYKEIIDNVKVGVYRHSPGPKGHFLEVNPALVEMLEAQNKEDLLKYNAVYFCRDAKKRREFIDKVLNEAVIKDVELEITTLKGKNIWVSISAVKKEDDHKQVYFDGIVRNITQRKKTELQREKLYRGIIEVFAFQAEEQGNIETASHIKRIVEYTELIAKKLRELPQYKDLLDESYIRDLGYASMLHDVGKWGIPTKILLKPGSLTKAEEHLIKQHPKIGVDMLEPILQEKKDNRYLHLIENAILYHHEQWDGSGYPKGLKGEEIPIEARIIALSDVYDALTSERSYRKPFTHAEAYRIITEDEKNRFDPNIMDIFKKYHLEFKKIKDSIK